MRGRPVAERRRRSAPAGLTTRSPRRDPARAGLGAPRAGKAVKPAVLASSNRFSEATPSMRSQIAPDVLRSLYERMLYVYYVEERTKVFVKSNKCSFHASSRGHEKLQICMAMLLEPGKDWFFPYYREKALMIGLGMPLKDVFLGMLSREGDPNSNGRNM